MKKRFFALVTALCLAIPLFSSCGKISDTTKTLFIYMCGSNLESKNGLGGKTIDEILSVNSNPNTRIIIETGGSKQWHSHNIDAKKTGRYEIRDGELKLIESLEMQNMGESSTLTDFVVWGKKNYPAKESMFIFWDHGGGSAYGVCSDENYNYDTLSFTEIEKGFADAKLSEKFSIIGFDACLMASLESAKAVKDYARYMVASEELEPGGGWDYSAFLPAFFQNNDPVETGKVICDSYLKKCQDKKRERFCTLSVADLSNYDKMLQSFEDAVKYINQATETKDYFSSITAAADACEHFGVNNIFEGGSNMIDLYDFLEKATLYAGTDRSAVEKNISSYILYSVSDSDRSASGLSFYYPILYKNGEIRDYINLGVSEQYNNYLRTYYLNVPPTTIEFLDKGHVNENGAFEIILSQGSKKYLRQIYYYLYEIDENGKKTPVFTGLDMKKNWNDMKFSMDFKGTGLALQGHEIDALQTSDSPTYADFITPVRADNQTTFLRFGLLKDIDKSGEGLYLVEGIWSGFDESNLPNLDLHPLLPGDSIELIKTRIPTSTDYNSDNNKTFTKVEIEYDGSGISRIPLEGKKYEVYYTAIDIFGNFFPSDKAEIEMTKTKDEILEKLPENEQAGKITKISPLNEPQN